MRPASLALAAARVSSGACALLALFQMACAGTSATTVVLRFPTAATLEATGVVRVHFFDAAATDAPACDALVAGEVDPGDPELPLLAEANFTLPAAVEPRLADLPFGEVVAHAEAWSSEGTRLAVGCLVHELRRSREEIVIELAPAP